VGFGTTGTGLGLLNPARVCKRRHWLGKRAKRTRGKRFPKMVGKSAYGCQRSIIRSPLEARNGSVYLRAEELVRFRMLKKIGVGLEGVEAVIQ